MSANGYVTNHKLYDHNISDILTLKEAVSKHSKTFGKEFIGAAADGAYYDQDLIASLEKKTRIALAIPHKKSKSAVMGKEKDELYNKRAAIEYVKLFEYYTFSGLFFKINIIINI